MKHTHAQLGGASRATRSQGTPQPPAPGLHGHRCAALAVAGTAGTANAAIQYDQGFAGTILVNGGTSSAVNVNITGGPAAAGQCRFSAGTALAYPFVNHFAVYMLGGAKFLGSRRARFPYPSWAGMPKRAVSPAVIGSAQDLWSKSHWGTLALNSGPQTFNSGSFKGKAGYLGVKFAVGSQTDYGWIELYGRSDSSYGEILGWAYDDQGNAIAAGDTGNVIPEPTSLAVWALVPGRGRRGRDATLEEASVTN